MGGRKAREIEDSLKLPRGSMDAPNLGKNLPRSAVNLTPRENLIADMQRMYRVDKETAEKGVAMFELMIDKPKASVKKRGHSRRG